jgi:predicted lipoprotein
MGRCGFLSVSAWLALAALLPACEKRPPRENVVPVQRNTHMGGGGGLDGSTFVPTRPDAGAADSDAEVETDTGVEVTTCSGEPPADEAFSKPALLSSIAACTTLQYCQLEGLAERFETAARSYAEQQTDANRDAARDAWYFLMRQVEVADLFQFGPAASGMEPGGQGVRDEIYIWPAANRCRLEELLVGKAYERTDFAGTPAAGRGLTAAEYLLFEVGSSNACPASRPINSEGSWAALSAEELSERKAKYLQAVAVDVLARARALHEAWRAEGGNFARELAEPDGAPYADQQAALNAVGGALLVYMDKQAKDAKLGAPLGLIEGSDTSIPALRESLYANVSSDHLQANLAGFRLLAQGCAAGQRGLGFDDWLRAANAGAVADDLIGALDAADEALATLDPPLDQALLSDRPKVLAVHAAIKRITDLLKGQVSSVLDLEPPMSVEGDND